MATRRSTGRVQAISQAVVLMFFVLGLSSMVVSVVFGLVPGAEWIASSLPWAVSYASGASIFLTSMLLIRLLSGGKFVEYGFNLRSADLKIVWSVLVGVLFAIVMALVDYAPPLIGGHFDLSYEPTPLNVTGRLSYAWIFLGIAEETLFRGLVQTHLSRASFGVVKILRWRIRWGTAAAALIYGASHLINVASRPVSFVFPQVVYTIFLGLAIGYLYQETGSLLGPIIAHNVADGLEYSIEFVLFAAIK